jgi:parallel beta-helix repeat protein
MGNTISKNTISDNGKDVAASIPATGRGPDASQYGIQLCEASFNVISGNQISDHNSFGFASGIYLFDSSNNHVFQNELMNNRQGIVLFAGGLIGSFGNTIEKNKIEKGVRPACDVAARGCAFAGAGWPASGIVVFDDVISSGNIFTKNRAINNAGDGFKVGFFGVAGGHTFTKNTSVKNTGRGFVEPVAPAGGKYTKNTCNNNGTGGSSTDGGATTTGGLCGPQL